jgi:hypothetical protein
MLVLESNSEVHDSDQHSKSTLARVLVELLGLVPGQVPSIYDWGRSTWLHNKTYVLNKQTEVQGYA